MAPFGSQLQSSIGDAVGAQDVEISLSGIGMQSSISPDSVIGALTIAEVSGSQLQTNIGEESTEGLAIVIPTGIASAFVLGSADPVSVAEVTGSQLQSSISGVSLTGNATINLTGIQLTGSLGSINITPWNEVDLGVNNTWTEVDLAA